MFLHAYFLICPPCPAAMSFPKFVNMTKNTPFFPNFARFCTPKRCTRVHCLVLKNNPNYIFFRGWYPTSNTSAPPPRVTQVGSQNVLTLAVGLCNSIGTVAKPTTFIFNYGWWSNFNINHELAMQKVSFPQLLHKEIKTNYYVPFQQTKKVKFQPIK